MHIFCERVPLDDVQSKGKQTADTDVVLARPSPSRRPLFGGPVGIGDSCATNQAVSPLSSFFVLLPQSVAGDLEECIALLKAYLPKRPSRVCIPNLQLDSSNIGLPGYGSHGQARLRRPICLQLCGTVGVQHQHLRKFISGACLVWIPEIP